MGSAHWPVGACSGWTPRNPPHTAQYSVSPDEGTVKVWSNFTGANNDGVPMALAQYHRTGSIVKQKNVGQIYADV